MASGLTGVKSNEMPGVAVEIPSSLEPVPAVDVGHVDHECVRFPQANRVCHVCVVSRPLDVTQVDGASRLRNA